ncbi:MAG: TIGR02281 family clan AA aspartic protease [Magnetococcales bacterium]|nr:TIGR02281 family clan AA aspartic protease [Magnetococcales bacterium]
MKPGLDTLPETPSGTKVRKDRPCCLKKSRRRRGDAERIDKSEQWSWIRFSALFGTLGAVVLLLHERFIGPLSGNDLHETLVGPLLLALVLGWLLASYPVQHLLHKIHQGLVWWIVILSLVLGFTFKAEMLHVLDRVMASLIPRFGYEEQPGSMTFYRAANGHFYIEALINRQPVSFLVDTGASGIILPPRIARKLGFHVEDLNYNQTFSTANGNVRVASVVLDDLRLGDLHMQGVAANVNGVPMRTALLGMQFFNQMLAWEVKGDVLTVRWHTKKESSPDSDATAVRDEAQQGR